MLNKLDAYINKIGLLMARNVGDASVYCYWKNSDSVYLGCSESISKISGHCPIVGKTDYDIAAVLGWDNTWPERFRAEDQQVMAIGQPQQFEDSLLSESNGEVILSTIKLPIWDKKSNVVGVFGISIDIGERKDAEAWLHKTAQLSMLADHMAINYLNVMHTELERSLAVLTNLIKFTSAQRLFYKQCSAIQTILNTRMSLLNLINNLLLLPPDEISHMLLNTKFGNRTLH